MNVVTTTINFYGGVDEVGGNKILIETEDGNVLLDFGRRMGFTQNYYAEFIQPRSKNALRDMCRLGILPKINGIYAPYLIDAVSLVRDPSDKTKIPLTQAPDYWTLQGITPYSNASPSIDAIFVTHAHFDHIQDVSFLDPSIPVYCTEETRVVAKSINDVSVSGVDDQYYELRRRQIITPKAESYKTLFPHELEYSEVDEDPKPLIEDPKCSYTFTCEYTPEYRNFITSLEGIIKGIRYKMIPVDHSIPGACSVHLTLPDGKRVLYTGDLRFHGTKSTTIDEYVSAVGDRVNVLIIEGTRIDSTEALKEIEVQHHISSDIHDSDGLVLINFGWKDLSRFRIIYESSIANNRTLVISPKLAYLLFEMHTQFPEQYEDPRTLPNLKVYLKREDSLLYSKADYDKWKMGYLDHHGRNKAKADKNIVRVAEKLECGGEKYETCTPQVGPDTPSGYKEIYELATHHLDHGVKAYEIRGNPVVYVLMFSNLDVNELFDLIPENTTEPSARYISAFTEPFNDEMEIDETKFMNWLDAFGVHYEFEVNDEKRKHFVRRHVSGHASQPELVELITKLDPGLIIPIHTSNPQLFQQLLPSKRVLVPEYGQKISL